MALAGSGLADDQRVGALADELQGVQLKAGAARKLRIEAPVEVRQRGPLIQARALEAALGQARAAPVQLVLEHGGEGLQKGLLGGLGLHHTGRQGLGNAGQAQLAQSAFDLDHVHDWVLSRDWVAVAAWAKRQPYSSALRMSACCWVNIEGDADGVGVSASRAAKASATSRSVSALTWR